MTIGMSLTHFSSSCFSGIGFNLLFTLLSFQLSLAIQKFRKPPLKIDIEKIVESEWVALASSLSLSAVVGVASNLQLLFITIIGVIFNAFNEKIVVEKLGAVDIGNMMRTVLWGSTFGIGVSIVLWFKLFRPYMPRTGKKLPTSPSSQFCSLLSCLLLLIYWPNFVAFSESGDKRHRIVVNLYLGMFSSIVTSYVASTLIDSQNRFNVVS